MAVGAAVAAVERDLFTSFVGTGTPGALTQNQTDNECAFFEADLDRTSDSIPRSSDLLPELTFDRYVVGPNNELAFSAARRVAAAPGEAFNPLYIYGPSSLGKTHLMQAIAHEIRATRPGLNVVYATTERFLTEFLACVKTGRMKEFRLKYRHADVLLLDDIHILKHRQGVQEEFLNTFNALYQSKKQIVFVSDVLPSSLDCIEPRLKTRFEWGLIVDVQYPDHATRLNILRAKAESYGIALDDETVHFVADLGKGDVRRLEGYLKRLQAFSAFAGAPMTIDRARQALEVFADRCGRQLPVDEIITAVGKYYSVTPADIRSSKRLRAIVVARQVAMYLTRQLTREGLSTIAQKFGGRDHTTVVHAVKKVESAMSTDGELKAAVESIRRHIEYA